ncbi:sensor histidine kinase [Dactylosporangium cerinum]
MDDVWNGEHLQRIRTWLFDGGVAGSVLYVTLLERRPEPAVVAIGLVMAAAMLGRRRYPVTVACVVYTAAPLHLLFDDAMRLYDMAVLISMFAVVKYRPQLFWGILAGVGAALGVVIGAAVEARRTDNFGTIAWVIGALTVAVWFSAYGVRTRRLYVASLEERAATLERERDHLARLAVADERAAIARELHDVVAHSLSVMIVQADGAGYTLDPSASRARQALDTIAATGRDALEDMRRVVSVLRGTSPGTDTTSRRRVGLAELDRLVERAGLRVDLDTVGTPTGLSVAEELTAYRIVQESLTNTLRHAGPDAKVTLRLEYASGFIAIEATDDGGSRPTVAATTRGGHGLVGMRERVALHGGTVNAGPRFDGGWSVAATIPRAPRVMGETTEPGRPGSRCRLRSTSAPSSPAPSSPAAPERSSPTVPTWLSPEISARLSPAVSAGLRRAVPVWVGRVALVWSGLAVWVSWVVWVWLGPVVSARLSPAVSAGLRRAVPVWVTWAALVRSGSAALVWVGWAALVRSGSAALVWVGWAVRVGLGLVVSVWVGRVALVWVGRGFGSGWVWSSRCERAGRRWWG